eukprot:CAMPEP_0119563920 /NCGR_PEP_ID=MMETSP1352-20130426/25242_1 /TAXON_ID=265584 /ORGANISM="Stauroneis constricta, Strain CCMP1120" /LENGTH=2377 /DNA_ID=CAMNT_0007612611 /DNA_START=158 /DNA_END=7291 /DNA_ORIENTATION=+
MATPTKRDDDASSSSSSSTSEKEDDSVLLMMEVAHAASRSYSRFGPQHLAADAADDITTANLLGSETGNGTNVAGSTDSSENVAFVDESVSSTEGNETDSKSRDAVFSSSSSSRNSKTRHHGVSNSGALLDKSAAAPASHRSSSTRRPPGAEKSIAADGTVASGEISYLSESTDEVQQSSGRGASVPSTSSSSSSPAAPSIAAINSFLRQQQQDNKVREGADPHDSSRISRTTGRRRPVALEAFSRERLAEKGGGRTPGRMGGHATHKTKASHQTPSSSSTARGGSSAASTTTGTTTSSSGHASSLDKVKEVRMDEPSSAAPRGVSQGGDLDGIDPDSDGSFSSEESTLNPGAVAVAGVANSGDTVDPLEMYDMHLENGSRSVGDGSRRSQPAFHRPAGFGRSGGRILEAVPVQPGSQSQNNPTSEEHRLSEDAARQEFINRLMLVEDAVPDQQEDEVVTEFSENPKSSWKLMMMIMLGLVSLVVAIVVGAIVGEILGTESKSPGGDRTNVTTGGDSGDELTYTSSLNCESAFPVVVGDTDMLFQFPSDESLVDGDVDVDELARIGSEACSSALDQLASAETITTPTSEFTFSWISLVGTANPIQLRFETEATTTGGIIMVYEGDQCDSLMCVEAIAECKSDCTLTFASRQDNTYHVAFGNVGRFEFSLSAREMVANDVCEAATRIDLVPAESHQEVTIAGSHDDASIEQELPCSIVGSRSTWYSVVGNGIPISASTCTSRSGSSSSNDTIHEMPTQLVVTTGECSNLQCVLPVTAYLPCDNATALDGYQVTWNAEADQEYRIVVVTSAAPAAGSSSPIAGSNQPDEAERESSDYSLSIKETVHNDLCTTAQPLILEDGFLRVRASNEEATVDLIPTCEGANTDVGSIRQAGTWWEIDGDGTLFRASTCRLYNFESSKDRSHIIQVFKGLSCAEMRCLDDTDSVHHRSCQPQATSALDEPSSGSMRAAFNEVTWLSSPGEKYYVLVSTADLLIGQSPPLISTMVSSDPPLGYEMTMQSVAINGVCETAIPLRFDTDENGVSTSQGSIVGSTKRAALPTEFTASCDGATQVTAPGVWYSIVGQNEHITIDTCDSISAKKLDPTFGMFDTQIIVLNGRCNGLRCVSGNNDRRGCLQQSSVTWYGKRREKYHILVFGEGLDQGDFVLSYRLERGLDLDSRPCKQAKGPLGLGSVDLIPVTSNQDEVFIQGCGGFQTTAPGLVYTTIGTGSEMVVSTCGQGTNYNSRVTLFRGENCDSLLCVVAYYDVCEHQNPITGAIVQAAYAQFDSEKDAKYYILVHGEQDQAGIADLTINEKIPNDVCDFSTALSINGDPVRGSILAATSGKTARCFTTEIDQQNQPGVWYRITPNTTLTLSLDVCIEDALILGLDINIYTGPCDALVCETGDSIHAFLDDHECVDGRSKVGASNDLVWIGKANVTYHIYVSGQMGGMRAFHISAAGSVMLDNDPCDVADEAMLAMGQEVTQSIAQMAFSTIQLECAPIDKAGVPLYAIYTILGSGNRMVASACTDDYLSKVSVSVKRGDCDDLKCIGSSRNYCGANGQVEWESVKDELYYIVVTSTEYSDESFVLRVDDADGFQQASIAHDECADAHNIQLDHLDGDGPHSYSDAISLSTMAATHDDQNSMCHTLHDQTIGGVWISIQGNGTIVEIRVDAEDIFGFAPISKEVDTKQAKFVVYEGACEHLRCVHSNTQVSNDAGDLSSFVTFLAERGTDYFVLIYNRMFETKISTISYDYQSQPWHCGSDAAEMIAFIGVGDSVMSAFGPTNTNAMSTDPCSNMSMPIGSWFSFVGTGDRIRASSASKGTNFDARIKIFEAGDDQVGSPDGCLQLKCLPRTVYHTDDSFQTSTVSVGHGVADWTTKDGQLYHIFVHGAERDDVAGNAMKDGNDASQNNPFGVFELSISKLSPQDECIGAGEITRDEVENLVTADLVGPNADIDTDWKAFPAVWYKVTGTGNLMFVSTCDPNDGFSHVLLHTHISVLTGSCSQLEVIDANDNYCDHRSQVAWDTVQDEEYFVLVRYTGTLATELLASIKYEQVVEVLSDCTETLGPMATIDREWRTATVPAVAESSVIVPTCNSDGVESGGLWFKTIGTGLTMSASTHGYGTRFNSSVAIFRGSDCKDLQCVDDTVPSWNPAFIRYDGSMELESFDLVGRDVVWHGSLTWQSELGEAYFVYVYKTSTAMAAEEEDGEVNGETEVSPMFQINETVSIRASPTSPNGLCQNAKFATDGDRFVGSTKTALKESVAICNPPNLAVDVFDFARAPGLWYHVDLSNDENGIPAPADIQVRVCDLVFREVLATVFHGDDCNDLTCIDTWVATNGGCASIPLTRDGVSSSHYWIMVYGWPRFAEFELTVMAVDGS